MLSTHAAAEFDDEVGDLVGHVLHDLDIAGNLRIDHRPDVQTAHAGVSVVPSGCAVLVNDVAEPDEEFRQLRWLNRAVFDKGDRFSCRLDSKQKAEAGARVVAEVEAAFAESLGPTERLALAKVLSSLR